MANKKVIISGGGTGGHVYPAIAIANSLRMLQPDIDILFVGANDRMEMEVVPKAGFRIKGLDVVGLQRKFTWKNLQFPVKLVKSLWIANSILREFKPDIVVGVGGYASGPTLEIANRMGIPTVIQEQNSYAGATNKLLANKAQKIFVAFPEMERFFPATKIYYTGNPIRQDIQQIVQKRAEGYLYYQLNQNKKTILLMGGSLGAKSLNEAVVANIQLLSGNEDIQVIWQCGKLYFEEYKNTQVAKLHNVVLLPFLERVDLAYSVADVVICRAGALTISEICMVQKPSVLVPSPNVAEDHQTKNAMSLVNSEAAVLVKDENANEVVQAALALLYDAELSNKFAFNLKKLARPDASQIIATEILKIINDN
ncbi:MAG: undecaprenyldiphospho-muramoylpentapeptide beta-N-acetylglucosaminyltransferase [Saprospiraceae bacterium]|nr:undecaprenyldiphospho-muramoylpentapeptide beta-N-acetylglucosaminyltransferase [Saprospiraceae bacterium]